MAVINYIMSLGASVMMPIIFLIFGIALGLGIGKSLKSGLSVGVGFVGLSVMTQLLADNLGPAVNSMVKIYHLHLHTLDIGWPAASTVAFGTEVGAIIIPLGLLINIIMLVTKTTKTLNIDLWNYWHFAFVGSIRLPSFFSKATLASSGRRSANLRVGRASLIWSTRWLPSVLVIRTR